MSVKNKESMSEINNLDLLKLGDLLVTEKNFYVKHQIESFNYLCDKLIPQILTDDSTLNYREVNNDIHIDYFKFHKISYTVPMLEYTSDIMTPQMAREKNLYYSTKLIADIEQRHKVVNMNTQSIIDDYPIGNVEEKVFLGRIPIMLRSKYCVLSDPTWDSKIKNEDPYDLGGYFIIHGSEKVVIPQERLCENKVFILTRKEQSTQINIAEIRSVNLSKTTTPQTFTIKCKKDGDIVAVIPQINMEIPIFILFRALGIDSDKSIISMIVNDLNDSQMINELRISMDRAKYIKTQPKAFEIMIDKIKRLMKLGDIDSVANEKKIVYLNHIFKNDLLPHMRQDFMTKAYFIGYMIKKLLIVVLGREIIDDRDNYSNKRVDLVGPLIAQKIKQGYKKLLTECGNYIKRKASANPANPINVIMQIKPSLIESDIKKSLLTGIWDNQPNKSRKGVAQVLNRLSYAATIASLRKVVSPVSEGTQKVTAPRQLHNSHWGFLCPVDTPEGAKVGLVKHISLLATFTLNMPMMTIIVKELLKDLYKPLVNCSPELDISIKTKLLVNGEWLGMTDNIKDIYNIIKKKREINELHRSVSIMVDYSVKEIRIFTDGGRCIRPIFKVFDNKLGITQDILNGINLKSDDQKDIRTFEEFLNKHGDLIEYIDTEETNMCLIAISNEDLIENQKIKEQSNPNKYSNILEVNSAETKIIKRYSHCEIHPGFIYGAIACNSPYSEHNQGPRNVYYAAQVKQAMGVYAANYRMRMDTLAHVLFSSEMPLVKTRMADYTVLNIFPTGTNAVVAIQIYGGFNQEDSIIGNRSSFDRGLFRSIFYRTVKDEAKNNPATGKLDKFTKPNQNVVTGIKPGSYDKLQENGFVKEGTPVGPDDIIIGKITSVIQNNPTDKAWKDNSTTMKNNEYGVVDMVRTGSNSEDYEMCKVRLRSTRIPQTGDKFSSRHAQKGTIGITLPQEDMPFSDTGIIPDLIMNPHAIPSRMTLGQLLECVHAKSAALKGKIVDGTPFTGIKYEDITDELGKLGYESTGYETMYCGLTGRRIKTKIFVGPIYYQRLRHLVEDKIHSRARGPQQILTRQPAEGRARDGGFRAGEMERDCMIAHGTSYFLKERLLDSSDVYMVHVCNDCGFFATKVKNKNFWTCNYCKKNPNISRIIIPYAFKLLIQELMSMGMAPRLKTSEL